MFNLIHKMAVLTALVISFSSVSFANSTNEKTKEITREIAPGVYSFAPGNNYHSMFVVTNKGVAVFETVTSKHSTDMLKEIRKITDQPIKYALHTHNHWDHASGGSVLQKEGAKTVMHTLAADWLAENPGKDTSIPDVQWEGARHDIKLGDLTIQLHHVGKSHGLGMTVFVIPERKVAYIGDLVTPNRLLFTIVPDFNIPGWERSLGEILNLDFDVAVCSHNDLPHDEALNGCTKTHVTEQRSFIQDLRKAIIAEFKKGTPANDIPKTVKLPKYAHWNHYNDWLPLNAQRILLDMWMGPY